jgi:hypothetical protein
VLDVNLMGQVHGSLAALPHLRRSGGGALICVSSVESKVSLPLHSAYAASKHGIAGFVDGLRRELLHDKAPVSVTNIMPATINTPFFNHALTKIGLKPQGPPPIYQPRVVADLILYAAENPVRDLLAGGAAKGMITVQKFAPSLMDRVLSSERYGYETQRTPEPRPTPSEGNFYHAKGEEARVEGDFSRKSRGTSVYSFIERQGVLGQLAMGGLLGTAAVLLMRNRAPDGGVRTAL